MGVVELWKVFFDYLPLQCIGRLPMESSILTCRMNMAFKLTSIVSVSMHPLYMAFRLVTAVDELAFGSVTITGWDLNRRYVEDEQISLFKALLTWSLNS